MKKSSNGFGAVEAIVIILVVGVIGFIGWFVYSRSDDKKSDLPKTSSQQTDATTAEENETVKDTPSNYSQYGYEISPIIAKATLSRSNVSSKCEADSSKVCSDTGVKVVWTKDTPSMVAVKMKAVADDLGFYGASYDVNAGGITIPLFIDPAKKANGTYAGTAQLQLQLPSGDFIDGPKLQYEITLED